MILESVCGSWKNKYILDLLFVLDIFLPLAPSKEKGFAHFFSGEKTNLTQEVMLHMQ